MKNPLLVLCLITAALIIPVEQVQAASKCKETGEGCAVGMVGPGGGVVFYDAGSMQWW